MENHTNNTNHEDVSSNGSIVSLENLNNVASWVSASVISAFFSSLERFSCVNVATTDPDDDEFEDDAKDRPLTLTNDSHRNDGVSDLPV